MPFKWKPFRRRPRGRRSFSPCGPRKCRQKGGQALLLASRRSVLGLGRWLLTAQALLGAGLLAFAAVADFAPVLLVLFVIGFGMMVQMAASNTLLQTIVPEDRRGRVMSFYTLAFLGMAPLGSLLTGALAAWLGPPLTLVANGLVCLASACRACARWCGRSTSASTSYRPSPRAWRRRPSWRRR